MIVHDRRHCLCQDWAQRHDDLGDNLAHLFIGASFLFQSSCDLPQRIIQVVWDIFYDRISVLVHLRSKFLIYVLALFLARHVGLQQPPVDRNSVNKHDCGGIDRSLQPQCGYIIVTKRDLGPNYAVLQLPHSPPDGTSCGLRLTVGALCGTKDLHAKLSTKLTLLGRSKETQCILPLNIHISNRWSKITRDLCMIK